MNLFKAPIMFSLTIDEVELILEIMSRAEDDLDVVADNPEHENVLKGYAATTLITMHSRVRSLMAKIEDQSGLDWEFDVATQRYFHVQDSGV